MEFKFSNIAFHPLKGALKFPPQNPTTPLSINPLANSGPTFAVSAWSIP